METANEPRDLTTSVPIVLVVGRARAQAAAQSNPIIIVFLHFQAKARALKHGRAGFQFVIFCFSHGF